MTHDQFLNPQRTVVEALKQAGFSVHDIQTLISEMRKPVERLALEARRDFFIAAALPTLRFEPADLTTFSHDQAAKYVANAAIAIADALIVRLA